MSDEKKRFKEWLSEHKKELIFAGVSFGSIILTYVGIKNKDTIAEMWNLLKNTMDKTNVSSKESIMDIKNMIEDIPIEARETNVVNVKEYVNKVQSPVAVDGHIRNLPVGWKASAEKLAEADVLGIVLEPGQTIVDGYVKGECVA